MRAQSDTCGSLVQFSQDTLDRAITEGKDSDSEVQILCLDEDESCSAACRALESYGYQVIVVRSGAQALARIHGEDGESPPSVVLIELLACSATGVQLLREIRQSYNIVQLPVLISTASYSRRTLLECFSLGCNDWLHRSFSSQEQVARIRAQVQVRRLAMDMRTLCTQDSLPSVQFSSEGAALMQPSDATTWSNSTAKVGALEMRVLEAVAEERIEELRTLAGQLREERGQPKAGVAVGGFTRALAAITLPTPQGASDSPKAPVHDDEVRLENANLRLDLRCATELLQKEQSLRLRAQMALGVMPQAFGSEPDMSRWLGPRAGTRGGLI